MLTFVRELLVAPTQVLQIIFGVYALMALASAFVALLPRSLFRSVSRRSTRLGLVATTVSILVPCRNEAGVILGTLEALADLDRKPDEVIVIDDNSSDGTAELAEGFIEAHGLADFRVMRRYETGSTKAKALNDALRHVTSDVVVILDADNQPEPTLVSRLLEPFANPETGAVQGVVRTKSGHNLISEIVALERIAGFETRMVAKERAQLNSQFGGTVAAVRTSLLKKLGGFDEACLTEDTDLTIRVILEGYRVRFVDRAVAHEDSPPTIRSYIGQKTRWAQGHFACLGAYFRQVLLAPDMSAAVKTDALFFLCYYLIHLFCGVAILIGVANFLVSTSIPLSSGMISLMFAAPFGEIVVGVAKRGEWSRLRYLPVMLAFYVLNIYCAWLAVFRLAIGANDWVKTARTADTVPQVAIEVEAA